MHVFDLSLFSQIEHYIIKTTYIDQYFKPCMAFRRNVRVRSQCYSCGVFLVFFLKTPDYSGFKILFVGLKNLELF